MVEGYTDVMAMHAAGVTTAVAACGTAFGEEHLQLLRRLMLDDNYFRGELIYTFDGDEAGQKAAMRAFDGDQQFTGQSYVSVAPAGMDPCDLRLAHGDAAVRDLVARRVPMFEFVVRAMIADFPLDSVEGRLQALRRAVPIVADIHDQTLRNEYARQLAGWIGWADPAEVLAQVRTASRRPRTQQQPRRARRFDSAASTGGGTSAGGAGVNPDATRVLPDRRNPRLWPERESLKIALQYPDIAGSYFDGLADDCFTHPAYNAVRVAIAAAGGCDNANEGVDWISSVAGELPDLVGRSLVSELAVEDIHCELEDLPRYADSVLSRLQEVRVGNHIAQLKGQLQRMRPSDDETTYNSLFADLVALEAARRELLDRAFKG